MRAISGAAVALVMLADQPQAWSSPTHALKEQEIRAASSLALQTLLHRQPWVVGDCLENGELAFHPAVCGAPWLRRLLGVPIHGGDGRLIGCLCALDFDPLPFAQGCLEALHSLAAAVALTQERRMLEEGLQRLRERRPAPAEGGDPAAVHQPAPVQLERQICLEALKTLFGLGSVSGAALLRLECRDVERYVATVGMEGLADLMGTVTVRIGAVLPAEATFCRFGEEEFLLVVPHLADLDALRTLASRLVESVGVPCRVGMHTLPLQVAVGAVLLDGSQRMLGSVLSEVGVARRLAASGSHEGFRLVDAGLRHQVRDDLMRQGRFREGLAEGAVVPFFQPIVDLSSGKLQGFEALARWRRSDGSLQVPAEFLPVAQQLGLTGELDLAVIRQALCSLPVLAAAAPAGSIASGEGGAGHRVISVNLSAQLLENEALGEQLLALLEASPPPPGWSVQVEILEDSLQLSEQRLDLLLRRLAALRVGIAIDDFGTGYSSLARLHTLPIQAFKIDRSFVERIDDPIAPSNRLLSTMNSLAIDLGLSVTAEGVASVSQRSWLRRNGFLAGQGFLFARPLSLEQALAFRPDPASADAGAAEELPAVLPRAGFWRRRRPGLT
ncbi:MAG: EAL domain-containing protein [Cyanobium sp.]